VRIGCGIITRDLRWSSCALRADDHCYNGSSDYYDDRDDIEHINDARDNIIAADDNLCINLGRYDRTSGIDDNRGSKFVYGARSGSWNVS
jgi:hypothetical protein